MSVHPVVSDRITLRPITRSEARLFLRHHRHCKPPSVCIAQVGLEQAGDLVGVGMLARPLARKLCDGYTAEISRVCTLGDRNACSMLYGALCRAAKALGYRRVVTYTLESESGSSLKGSGFKADKVSKHNYRAWESQKSTRSQSLTLFGERTTPDEPKVRWWRHL